ncbi:MAG: YeeE/YedE family protein [Syntrophaceae bacterium]|nr:YeeE/YedE family protein [Syntrophaceae bacterium]
MEWLSLKQWSPYVVGIGIGVLNCIAFLLSDKPLACSTAYSRTSGMLEGLCLGPRVTEKPYYKKFPPTIEWDWMLVQGIIIGAITSSILSGQFHFEWVPEKWGEVFGGTAFFRWIFAFIGGIIMGIGARWANGCTSGHGISGTLQLAVSSWLAAICFFVGGILTAMLIYGWWR